MMNASIRKNIVTLCGGFSSERDISIDSGNVIARGIFTAGYKSYLIDTAHPEHFFEVDEKFVYKPAGRKQKLSGKKIVDLLKILDEIKPHTVFIGLHGGEGENGQIQALLDLAGYRYTGSGCKSSAIGMDKNITKLIAKSQKVPVADWEIINSKNVCEKSLAETIQLRYGYPVVIKAIGQGSSVGVEIVQKESDLPNVIKMIDSIDDTFIIEQFIKGRELSIPIVQGYAFPPIEIKPKHGFYSYENKYQKGKTEHICPAPLLPKQLEKLGNLALTVYQALGCKDYARIDFILGENNKFYFLEVNTLPGMTELSLLPESALANGYKFHELIKLILQD